MCTGRVRKGLQESGLYSSYTTDCGEMTDYLVKTTGINKKKNSRALCKRHVNGVYVSKCVRH